MSAVRADSIVVAKFMPFSMHLTTDCAPLEGCGANLHERRALALISFADALTWSLLIWLFIDKLIMDWSRYKYEIGAKCKSFGAQNSVEAKHITNNKQMDSYKYLLLSLLLVSAVKRSACDYDIFGIGEILEVGPLSYGSLSSKIFF